MYIPAPFAALPGPLLRAILPEASFALLITSDDAGLPVATHLPVAYDADGGGEGGLIRGHVAKSNPHGALLDGRPALIVFSGPHGYVSPTDYATGNQVPTWHYLAVHAYGPAGTVEDADRVRDMLSRLTADNEQERTDPWSPEQMEAGRIEAMMKGIVAFEMRVERLEGQAKLGQHKSLADRQALANAARGGELEEWQERVAKEGGLIW
ncbi:FMN-binding negative transcriptional regulator [Sneathiella chinensis]|uniref:Transcriptional regulator n=1 Tax=Sneathiella chinensis TaxID=349750 RepID=A0ABQ5U9J3_9PROT|nr:FMN-binding negative transcriptional regulator [Sneathiella chinensis]GLQ07848.1 transcriptional regulator [Sneathiella chinensis]